MKEYLVDGSAFSVEDLDDSFLVVRKYAHRSINISKEDIGKFGSGGLMGVAHRFGLGTFAGKAFKLLANVIKQDIDGNWILG